ncbi:MAG TPA: type VI secretion system baseplate subunit TssG [Pyrinomonadaceae bacterium]|nr:type VI secretion system baseplate subunit TssG [Pyrinomonadaceae bacterium]
METVAPDDGRTDSSVADRYGWGKPATLESWLFAEGHRFDFFQAVRLLEMIRAAELAQRRREAAASENEIKAPQRRAPGESLDPKKEIVRFRSSVTLDFPASDIAEVALDDPASAMPRASRNEPSAPAAMVNSFREHSTPAEITVNFLGLAGGLGALDIPTTELILQRRSRSDEALKDFLDIFNHRLVSLLYRIRKHHRVGLGVVAPGEDQIANYLFSLIGLGTANLRGRMLVRDRSLLYYAGILAQSPRSMSGLERIIADYFQVEVKGRQFVGEWQELDESQWTTIGRAGRNQRLGRDTVILGTRIWNQEARFEIELGPLSFTQFFGFLPTSWRFGVLCDLIKFYVQDRFNFSIRLTVADEDIPGSRLMPPEAYESGVLRPDTIGLLAWTSRLHSTEQTGPVRKVNGTHFSITISPETLLADTESIKGRVLAQLPKAKQQELLGRVETRVVQKGSIVMLQGDAARAMFVIRKGKVQISRQEKGKERVVGVLRAGDSFGELALLTKKPYSTTALTLKRCEIAVIKREELDAFGAQYRSLRKSMDAYLEGWMQAETTTRKVRVR